MLDENVKVGAKPMTEFWNAKDALHILGAVMNNPRWSWSARSPDGRIVVIVLALLAGAAATAADAAGLPGPLPAPTIYSVPTPAPLAPPINPGPAIVPPAGLSPLLTQPGPVFATPQTIDAGLSLSAISRFDPRAEYAGLPQPSAATTMAARSRRDQPRYRAES
jgi:hypothetical protein